MIVISLIKHNFRRQWRDRLGLGLTLLTAPFLVVLYGVLFSQDRVAPEQTILVACEESFQQFPDAVSEGGSIINLLEGAFTSGTTPTVVIRSIENPAKLKNLIRSGEAAIGIECARKNQHLPVGPGNPVTFILHGNTNQPFYQVGSASIQLMIYKSLVDEMGLPIPVEFKEKGIGEQSRLTTFDRYVPALLVFATIMLVFSAAMSVTREVENGTLERLRMTRLSTFELMVGLSVVQLTLGIMAVALTFFTAWVIGFNTEGPLIVAFLLTVISCFSSVGLGMVVASLSRTLILSFLIASVSMFLMVLFSGIVLPRPEVLLFELNGQPIDLLDILPTTHLGVGLEKVLILGASMGEIAYEAGALLLLSVVYFGIGVRVFRKTSYSFFVR